MLFQVNCSALRSSPRTDSTQFLLTLSSTRSHAHKTVQCLPFTACSELLALCHTTTRVGHSRVLYCCLSYRVSLSVCTVCAAAPSPPSPSHCCTCLTTTVSHCRGNLNCTLASLYSRTVPSHRSLDSLYARPRALSSLCTLDSLHSRLFALSSPCALDSLHSRAVLSRRTLNSVHCTLVSLQSRLSVSRTVLSHCTLALHFRTALSHCTLVTVLSSLYPRLFALSSLCTVLSTLYSHLCLSHCTLDSVDCLYPHLCTLSHSALIVHSALARSFCTLVSVLSILCTVLSSLCNRGSLSPALCSRKPACATLAASLTMAHCLVRSCS